MNRCHICESRNRNGVIEENQTEMDNTPLLEWRECKRFRLFLYWVSKNKFNYANRSCLRKIVQIKYESDFYQAKTQNITV